MLLADERAEICEYARRMVADGLVVGTSGNVSARSGDLVAVTPTGVRYETLTPEDIPVVSLDGSIVEGELLPTSELPMHLSVYNDAADPEGKPITSAVHTHSVHATAVSTLVEEVPPVHYMLATIGETARVAKYATYGTRELADSMLDALTDRRGCLLANHGTITYGDGLAAAYDRARQLEWVCQLWLTAAAAGVPTLLSEAEMAHIVKKIRDYGQR